MDSTSTTFLVSKLAPRSKQPWVPTSASPTKTRPPPSVSHHSTSWATVQDFLDRSHRFMHDPTRRMVSEAEAVRALRREHEAVLLELGSTSASSGIKSSTTLRDNTSTTHHLDNPLHAFPTIDGTYFSTRSEFPSNLANHFPPTPLDARVPPPPPPPLPPPTPTAHAPATASSPKSPTKRAFPTYASPTKRHGSTVRKAYASLNDTSRSKWSSSLELARDELLDEGISGIYLVNRTLDPPSPPRAASTDVDDTMRSGVALPSVPDTHVNIAGDESMVVDPLDAIGRFRQECGLADMPSEKHVEPQHYYSGYFQATKSSRLVPLVGGRTPDQDDPPVKVRITASVARELQAYRKPVKVKTRTTYYDEESMALNDHLHAGCTPNLTSHSMRTRQVSMALKAHVVDVKDDGLTPAWAPKAARASAYRTGMFRV